jgi:hypothetical protein
MKMKRLLIILFVLFSPLAMGQEKLVFTAPVLTDPGGTSFTITYRGFDEEAQLVIVRFRECDSAGVWLPNGKVYTVKITGYDALLALSQLETANFSTVSFKRKLIAWLQQHGTPPYLPAGTTSGNPTVPTTSTTLP